MATLVLKNKNRALRNDSCPVEFDPDTRIELTGFVIVSTRKYDTIYRKQNIRSPEKNVLTKNMISLENIVSVLSCFFSYLRKSLLIPFWLS